MQFMCAIHNGKLHNDMSFVCLFLFYYMSLLGNQSQCSLYLFEDITTLLCRHIIEYFYSHENEGSLDAFYFRFSFCRTLTALLYFPYYMVHIFFDGKENLTPSLLRER